MVEVGVDVGGRLRWGMKCRPAVMVSSSVLMLVARSRISCWLIPALGDVRLAKVASTLDNQADGVLCALKEAGADLGRTSLIVHGTTTTTNAVLEGKLSRTGLITTRGFRDVLELGRRTRPQPYGMKGRFRPIVPRDLRLEVTERMDAQGQVVKALDEAEVAVAARGLLEKGCESVLVHFLHAYANPSHELRAGEIIREIWPNDYVTLGHSILSESREYERGVTAAVNASVQPILERYIGRLNGALADGGYDGELLVMGGNGGMVSSRLVSREAAKTVMSGPASGVKAAAFTAKSVGIDHIITYDMGGTSTDVALVRGGEPSVSNEIEIEYALPIHVPMVDVRTVGAGGGSIARVNEAGLLEVGPDSAGAHPGPICYGRGGTQATISDANLLLGRLDAGTFGGGDREALEARVASTFAHELGDRLGLHGVAAAEAVIRVAIRRWRALFAWYRYRLVPIHAITRCLRLAARGLCMQHRWPGSLPFPRSLYPCVRDYECYRLRRLRFAP